MKYGELKKSITEYLATGMSEFKEKGDQGEGLFVTHLVKSSQVRVIVDDAIATKRETIYAATMSSNMRIAEIACLNINKRLVYDRYSDILHNHSFPNRKIDIVTATDFLNYAFTTLGLDVTLDGRNVIDKYYELNDSKEVDDTISILELRIPRGSSNGDVFKAVFPKRDYVVVDLETTCAYRGAKIRSDRDWWDVPYEGGRRQ